MAPVTIAQTSARRLVFKAESSFGTAPASTGGQVIRRVTNGLGLTKETFESNEKRADFQVADMRHGLRRVSGPIDGEMYVGAWQEFFEAALRRDATSVSAINAASGDGFSTSSGVLTRGAGGGESFITDGIKVGQVVRLTNMATTSLNNRNFIVSAVTATTLTLIATDGAAIADMGSPDTAATITVPGQVNFIPLTGHTSKSFAIEDHMSDVDVSRLYTGCRIGGFSMDVQPNAMATVQFPVTGLDQEVLSGASAPYFTSPTAAGVQKSLSGTPAYIKLGSGQVVCCTGFNISIDLGLEAPAVVGANVSPNVLYGSKARISGQLTAYLEDNALLTAFRNETEVEVFFYLEAPAASAPGDFCSLYLGRVKINSADADDPDTGLVQTVQFMALLPEAATGKEQTSFYMHDSTYA